MNSVSAPGEPQVVHNGLQSPPINTSKDMASRLASKLHDAQSNYDVMSTGSNMKASGNLIDATQDLANIGYNNAS
ncbi:hypothetical protein H9Q69_004221 [Fusarium xylarioides]|uniref:Uncharacterized protein n=1 Tax=Fusarium xylarioides TaxID=221167 RepID=A0A9P7IV30_9HYPO|nr:hypothetical protein H9Q70_003395 [Fusarium xylarioides]KAG5769858.1 hypothetical protein H9Q72_003053 [Fusarium xylarioides]KAG5796725.1 hypothetical protein H9Q69_004221 [Fusarium xylarioides]KAG5812975.1 hypothetical protein H9Q71_004050 [Fusarium xylarioides]KAG5826147.1 hypothetical protein H9Q74_003785 [Fusarium xylarioides]